MSTIKERPILFSAPMVRAYLDGRKMQTRRVVKPQPTEYMALKIACVQWIVKKIYAIRWRITNKKPKEAIVHCPYGKPGDRLWVREKQMVTNIWDSSATLGTKVEQIKVEYLADNTKSGWIYYPERLEHKPIEGVCLPYGGYRESSRIDLEITDIRVERVQEIRYEDALAEGVDHSGRLKPFINKGDARSKLGEWQAVASFMHLWDSINGKKHPWADNPWVWVVEFKRLEGAK